MQKYISNIKNYFDYSNNRSRVVVLYIVITSLLFITRLFLFIATQDIGVEHDSGWYLGVARNVAERGIYASYTNTVSTTEKAGGFPSIHNRFSVQDRNGFIYLPSGVTVGPGYILPEAFFLKLFGYGWVQYRLWPFIAFCLLIPLIFYVVFSIGSLSALLFFQIWLWCYPQLFLVLSFESFSEHIALLFLIVGYILLQKWIKSQKNICLLILSGLSLGIALQTKNLYALGVLIPIVLIGYHAKKTRSFRSLFFFLFFITLPTALFESYRFFTLFSQFGLGGYWANLIDIKRIWGSGGSGIKTIFSKLNFQFIYEKFSIWRHVGVNPYFFAWPFILISPLIHKRKTYIYWTLYTTTLIFFIWFGMFSTTGWFRHIFPGIVMGMMIISLTVEDCILKLINSNRVYSFFILILFLGAIYFPLLSNSFAIPHYILTRKQITSLYKTLVQEKIQGPLFAPIFSKIDQVEVSAFIDKSINKTARICFYERFLVAEIPPLVDRVFYPYQKCKENDFLIVGPYQKGKYVIDNFNTTLLIQNLCKRRVFENISYTICSIKSH